MAVQVKAGVPFPGRMADIERRRHYPLLVTRDEVDFRCDVLDEALVRYSTLEDRYRADVQRSEEHTSELQSRSELVCRLLLEKKKHYKWLEAEDRATHHHFRLSVS